MAKNEKFNRNVEKSDRVIMVDSLDVVDMEDLLFQPTSDSIQSSQQRPSKQSDHFNSTGKTIRLNSSRHDSDDDYSAPKKTKPKIVLKNQQHTNFLSKIECDLIKDCVEALADQDYLETFKLRTRTENLDKVDWKMISEVMVKIMRQYMGENGIHVIDHKHFAHARLQMKKIYKWAGHVVGKDFRYCESIRSITQDSCYSTMRNRHAFLRPRPNYMLSKRTVVRRTFSATKKTRTADSYGVLVYENLDIKEISDEKRQAYELFCKDISKIPVGHQLSQNQIETASGYWDCLMESLIKVKSDEFQDFIVSDKLGLLKHLRLYSNFVQKITQREDVLIIKFQKNCDMYLACLQDLFNHFPPIDKFEVKRFDIENQPYISMIKIIASQLGKKAPFILERKAMSPETQDETGPICLVKFEDLYNLCINGVTVVPHLQEIQALFCLATCEDVFRLRQFKVTESSDVIDFMRKFFLDIQDFNIKRPKITLLGQAFRTFSGLETSRNGKCPRPNKTLCYEKAFEAINCY